MRMSIIRFYVLVIFSSFYLQAYSQTDHGKILLGGQYILNFTSYTSTFKGSNNSYELGKYRTVGISPQIGFFIFKNVPFGAEFLYSYGKTTKGSSDSHNSSYSLIPFLRYYFGQSKIKPYVHLGAGPGWQKTIASDFGYTTIEKAKLFRYQLKGGLCAFINDHVSLDFSLGYYSTTQSLKFNSLTGSGESKVINKGLDAVIGLVVYL